MFRFVTCTLDILFALYEKWRIYIIFPNSLLVLLPNSLNMDKLHILVYYYVY